MQYVLHTASKYMWCTHFNPLSSASTIRGKKKNMNIFVDYSLLQVSCFRKASFLEKVIQSDHGRICRVLSHFEGGYSHTVTREGYDHISQLNAHHFHRVKASLQHAQERTSCDSTYWFLFSSLLSRQLSSHLFCSPVSLSAHSCEWGGGTDMGTLAAACHMVWAADISLQVICESESDANTLIQENFYQWMRDFFFFFFNPVHLIKDTCELDSHYITLHSLLWLHDIYHEQPQFNIASANCYVRILSSCNK